MAIFYRLAGVVMAFSLLIWQGSSPLQAQEGEGLSEEEVALVERLAEGVAGVEALESYTGTRDYVLEGATHLAIPTEADTLQFDYLENLERHEVGRVIRLGDI